jgi:hypothetical protein
MPEILAPGDRPGFVTNIRHVVQFIGLEAANS